MHKNGPYRYCNDMDHHRSQTECAEHDCSSDQVGQRRFLRLAKTDEACDVSFP